MSVSTVVSGSVDGEEDIIYAMKDSIWQGITRGVDRFLSEDTYINTTVALKTGLMREKLREMFLQQTKTKMIYTKGGQSSISVTFSQTFFPPYFAEHVKEWGMSIMATRGYYINPTTPGTAPMSAEVIMQSLAETLTEEIGDILQDRGLNVSLIS
jgi:hypothetical protein